MFAISVICMREIPCKIVRCIGMTLLTGCKSFFIGKSTGRIAVGDNVVMPVTIMAGRHALEAEYHCLAVECLAISPESIFMTLPAAFITGQFESDLTGPSNFMCRVTGRTYGAMFITGLEQLPVNTLTIYHLNTRVTGPARFGDIVTMH